jgi:VWFA-related protein
MLRTRGRPAARAPKRPIGPQRAKTRHEARSAMMRSVSAVACAALLGSVAAAFAQATPTPAAGMDTPQFRTGTAVVVLDVVARDKKGRPVRDLRAEDLQVFENDQRCEVKSFRLIESEGTIEPSAAGSVGAPVAKVEAPAAAAPAAAEAPPVNLVTLVFDRLSLEADRLAGKAARDFVERGIGPRTQVAVFNIGLGGLTLVQPFTAEREPLRQAIELATSGRDTTDKPLTRDWLQAERNARKAAGGQVAEEPARAADAATPSAQGAVAGDPLEVVIRQAMASALRLSDSLQRQNEGNSTLYPLLALVKAQGRLSGRKTLVFFSQGLAVPPNLDDVFRTIVSEANRANVSVYSVDARGLGQNSDIQSSGAALREAATTSMTQQMKGAGEATTAAEMNIMDTADSSLRMNAQQTLSDLSEGTGGFLVANANDFGKAVDRLAADIRGYYEVTYVPAVTNFDGSFRRVSVKVARKDVALQSRSGYFALPPTDQVVLPFEMPLLAALSLPAAPHDFGHQASALHFGAGADGVETAVVVEVPLAPLDFTIDAKKKTFALRLTTLAVVKDGEGRIVERFSDQYPLAGTLDQLEALKQSNAVLRRTAPLAPGAYTLETAARAGSGKTSVQRLAFEVPAATAGAPRLSSLSLLRRADPLPADAAAADDPFRFEATRLVPHLAGPVSKAATPNLSFFARVYPTDGIAAPVLTLDFVRDGKIIGRAQPPLPAADAGGRIAYVGGVPSAGLAPGQYEVRLTVTQGGAKATEATRFELVP